MRLLNDRILIQVDKVEQPEGSLYIPDSAREKPSYATVIAVGPGLTTSTGSIVPVGVEADDRIMFNPHAGIPVKPETTDDEFLLISPHDIFLVL